MKHAFAMHVTVENATGRVVAVYFQIREGHAKTVKEFSDGAAFANYNARGELMGIELLSPCEVQVLDKIASTEVAGTRRQVREFLRSSVPRRMVRGLELVN